MSYKRVRQKTNKIYKIVQSKQQSNPASEKMHTMIAHKSSFKAIKASMIKQGNDKITK